MRIGELADRTGVSVRALRYYEEKGALRPRRTPAGYRAFEEQDVFTVHRIQDLLAAGLGLDLIAQILSCVTDDAPLLSGCRDRLGQERRRMTADIDRLLQARSLLDGMLASNS